MGSKRDAAAAELPPPKKARGKPATDKPKKTKTKRDIELKDSSAPAKGKWHCTR